MSEVVSESSLPLKDDIEEGQVLVSSNEMVLMQTAKAEIINPKSSTGKTARLLLDSGSQRTYITEDLAKRLGLKTVAEHELKLVTFGSETPKIVKTRSTQLDIKLKDGSYLSVTANIVPTISGQIQRNPIKNSLSKEMEHLVNSVELADTIPSMKEQSTIEVLIGNDYYLDLVLTQKIELGPGLYLLSSKLGWILTGRAQNEDMPEETSLLILTYGSDVTHNSAFSSIDAVIPTKPDLQDFWNVESIGITDQNEANDEVAMKKFRETVKFEDNRYQVTWPWKDEDFELPVNKQLALGRLKSTMTRLRKHPELMEKYNTVIDDQLNKGVIERVSCESEEGRKHYIPHHAVITPQTTTTKLRVVYDASAKTRPENKSLNDCLYRGPVLLKDLCGILMRFRLHQIALVADIEKAFLQIGLQPDQRDVTRFLWLKDKDNPSFEPQNVQEYRFCRVPFGIISSPFLLGATVQSHLDTYNTDLAEKVKDNIYVDNLITGTDTVGEAVEFYNKTKLMFKEATMNLREWISNSAIVNKCIPENDRAKNECLGVLGLQWNPDNDVISVKPIDTDDDTKPTKRTVLKVVASNYDPLGLFAPILLNGKVFIQHLWTEGIKWDDNLSEKDEIEWRKIKEGLGQISSVNIPRCVTKECSVPSVKYSLCCFCDASEKAYATTVYLRIQSESETHVELMFSKSRLAPLKKLTIPRLEIMAVLIGVRCVEFVKKELHVTLDTTHLFIDSQCCLQWIDSDKDLPVFVKNRVKEIKKHDSVTFAYVNTSENPADVATRGTSVEKLQKHDLWWHGPIWLRKPIDEWPPHKEPDIDQVVEAYFDNVVEYATADLETNQEEETINSAPFEIDIESYSSVTKLVRVTAYCLRFIDNIRNHQCRNGGQVKTNEIRKAEQLWIKHIQRKHFGEVFVSISKGKKNNLQRQLNLYVDDNGLLRCKGRLQNAALTESARFPILLPKNDLFTSLIVDKRHKQLLHSGVSHTLSHIRNEFWIPRGRSAVKTVLNKCTVCRRYEGGPYPVPNMPPLPESRVTESQPFANTGLDYFGPLNVKASTETQKTWVCLFTCLVTRAIHLELVLDMSSQEFLMAVRRFISSRGVPVTIISDNAMQFKTAGRTLDSVWNNVIRDDDVQGFIADKGITWTYIVQLAPWMGGFYERLVGVVKRSMRKSLGRKLLTLIQMQTLLKEVEAVVNTRPLVYVSDDINSNITLTPGHFLSLNPKTGIPDIEEDDTDYTYTPSENTECRLLRMWSKGQKLLNEFWKIWRNEYLLSLRERTQTRIKTGRVAAKCFPTVGDIVHVKEELGRSRWKMGKIVTLRHSSDGNVRSAKVKLASGRVIRRPLPLLFPIETNEKTTKDSHEHLVPDSRIQRPKRAAAETAREKIRNQVSQ